MRGAAFHETCRIQAGFEYGLPGFLNLFADYEQQLRRNLSVHGGVRGRYTGFRLEAGARYALIKSTRTQTVVTALGDIALNTDPAYPVFRPQLAAGHRFGKLDAQIQAGTELDTRKGAGVRYIGGVNFTYKPSDRVAVFAESQMYMQNVTAQLSSGKDNQFFRFNTVNFGLKFYPKIGSRPNAAEVNVGASAPYTTNYWAYHFGSIMVQGNYYLK